MKRPFFLKPIVPYFGGKKRIHLEAVYRGEPIATAAAIRRKAAKKKRDIGPPLELLFHYRKMGDRKNLNLALSLFKRTVYRNSRYIRRRKNLYFYLAWAYGIAGYHKKSIRMHLANYRSSRWTRNLYFAAYRCLDLGRRRRAKRLFRLYLSRTRIYSNRPAYYLEYGKFLLDAGYPARSLALYRRGAIRHPRSEKLWIALLKYGGSSASIRKIAAYRGLYHASRDPEMLVALCSWFIENGHASECRSALKKYFYRYRRGGHAVLYLLQSIRLTEEAQSWHASLRLLNLLTRYRRSRAGRGEMSEYIFRKARLLLRIQNKKTYRRLVQSRGKLLDKKQKQLLTLETKLVSGANTVMHLPSALTRTCSGLKAVTLLFAEYDRERELIPVWQKLIASRRDPAADWEYGMLLCKLNLHKKALPYLIRAWRETPDSGRWPAWIARAALYSGKNKIALRFFLRALSRLGALWMEKTLGRKKITELVRRLQKIPVKHPAVNRVAVELALHLPGRSARR